MFTAMSRVRQGLVERARAELPEDARPLTINAINQLLDLELAIMLDSYRAHWAEQVRSGERLATIGKFAASIGHELRNPLGIVESSIFLIGQRLGHLQLDDPNINKHRERITHQVKVCGATISSLLELARDNPPVRTRQLLRETIDDATKTITLGEDLQIEYDFDLEQSVLADVSQLRQVFSNLLLNAAHALEGRGKVRISARENEEGLAILVIDEGPGIPRELHERVFDIWFTTKSIGTGVGLALSRKIAEAHGGTLTLEPSNIGACFRVWLPLA
jgi:signal transduction histidine kinase